MIGDAIDRDSHGREVQKGLGVMLRITDFEERVEGAARAGVAFGWIPPFRNGVIDERIVEQLAGFVI